MGETTMTAKCKACGTEFPAETIERMLERCDRYDPEAWGMFTKEEVQSGVSTDIIRNQWPALIRGLMAKSDPRPLLTPESVDAIDPEVCKAVDHAWNAGKLDNTEKDGHVKWGRHHIRAVAAHCRVPQPSRNSGQLDSVEAEPCFCNEVQTCACGKRMHFGWRCDDCKVTRSRVTRDVDMTVEADRIIEQIIGTIEIKASNAWQEIAILQLRELRSRLTLKPRRLSETEDRKLVEFARRACLPGYINAGHAIAAEVARLWGLEVPEERTARALGDEEAEELYRICKKQIDNASTTFILDGRFIYAEALRLAGRKVAEPVTDKPQADRDDLEVMADDLRALDDELLDDGFPPDCMVRSKVREVIENLDSLADPAPVAAVELSEDEQKRFSQWLNFEGETGMAQARSTIAAINRILAARKAKDVADMQPPFEGPKRGFAVPDEANANVNGLAGDDNGND